MPPVTACPVCGVHGHITDTLVGGERMFGLGGRFTYALCGACGSLWLTDPPDDPGAYYGSGYSGFGEEPDPPALLAAALRARDRTAAGGVSPLGLVATRLLPADPAREAIAAVARATRGYDDRIIDVGCGSGVLLERLRAIGYRDLTGVDPFAGRVVDMPGLRIVKGEHTGLGGTWDVVAVNHAFEHMPDPRAALAGLAALLAPGGRLVIRVPVADADAREQYREDWVQLDPPRHLVIPSRAGLATLAADAGLRISSLRSDSTAFQFWGSEQYRAGMTLMDPASHLNNPRGSMFSRRDIAGFTRRARAANRRHRGDQVAVVMVAGGS